MAAVVSDTRDGVTFTAARTADVINFVLLGGKYGWGNSTPSTSATLSSVMPDGSVQTVDNETAADYKTLDLVAGSYRLTFVATGDVSGFVQRVPYNASH